MTPEQPWPPRVTLVREPGGEVETLHPGKESKRGSWEYREYIPMPRRVTQIKRAADDELGRWAVWRTRQDGSFDYVTLHFTRLGALWAADIYSRTGKVRGRTA